MLIYPGNNVKSAKCKVFLHTTTLNPNSFVLLYFTPLAKHSANVLQPIVNAYPAIFTNCTLNMSLNVVRASR